MARKQLGAEFTAVSHTDAVKRADEAFSAALSATVSSQARSFTPPSNELAAINREVKSVMDAGGTADPAAIIARYVKANPSSKLARAYAITGGVGDWADWSSGQVRFDASKFEAALREHLESARDSAVAALSEVASNSSNRRKEIDLSSLDPHLAKILSDSLSAQSGMGSASIPIKLEFAYSIRSQIGANLFLSNLRSGDQGAADLLRDLKASAVGQPPAERTKVEALVRAIEAAKTDTSKVGEVMAAAICVSDQLIPDGLKTDSAMAYGPIVLSMVTPPGTSMGPSDFAAAVPKKK